MPLAYLLTWRCYGTFLHGDPESVDRRSNFYGDARRTYSAALNRFERSEMRFEPVVLDPPMRDLVHSTIETTCAAKSWELLAINARTNHVHVFVSADRPPERVLTTLKAWSTRQLRTCGCVGPEHPVWSRHGSTKWLMREDDVTRAIFYVTDMQDDPERWNGSLGG